SEPSVRSTAARVGRARLAGRRHGESLSPERRASAGALMDLRGKAALVTGSATGIGRATALALARRGCHVVVNYTRSEAEAKATVRDVEALGVRDRKSTRLNSSHV